MAEEKKKVKSALDIAMERFGSPEESGPVMTAEQKRGLAEAEKKYQAKVAEKDVVYEEKMRNVVRSGDYQAVERLREEKAKELRELKEQMEREKEKVRQG